MMTAGLSHWRFTLAMRSRQKYRSHPMSSRQKGRDLDYPKKNGWTRRLMKFWRALRRTKSTAAAAATGSRSSKASAPGDL